MFRPRCPALIVNAEGGSKLLRVPYLVKLRLARALSGVLTWVRRFAPAREADLRADTDGNRARFAAKWRAWLVREHQPPNTVKAAMELAADPRRGPRVIVFELQAPSFDRDSGSLRLFLLLQGLAQHSQVVFVPLYPHVAPQYELPLERVGVRVARPQDFAALIRDGHFDAAILSRPEVADALLGEIKRLDPRLKIIFDTVDVHFVRLQREYELNHHAATLREARRLKRIETRAARACAQVWCVTPADADVIRRVAPGADIRIVPNLHPIRPRGAGFAARAGLLFIGSFAHRPNQDAVLYFVKEVLPLVRAQLPGVKFYAVGGSASPEVAACASDDVIITGYVPDVDPLFHRCRLFVAPLRFGAGMKGKVGQALSYGLPSILTPVAAEGIGLTHGREALIVDGGAQGFARAVIESYQDEALWRRLADAGYHHVEKHFTPEVVNAHVRELIEELCIDGDNAWRPQPGASHACVAPRSALLPSPAAAMGTRDRQHSPSGDA